MSDAPDCAAQMSQALTKGDREFANYSRYAEELVNLAAGFLDVYTDRTAAVVHHAHSIHRGGAPEGLAWTIAVLADAVREARQGSNDG